MWMSMTGFGRGDHHGEDVSVIAEARSVNHRFLDIHVRCPVKFLSWESRIRSLVRGVLRRGKVDVFLSVRDWGKGGTAVRVNHGLLSSFLAEAGRLRGEAGLRLRGLTGEIVSLAGENRELSRSRFRERIEALSGEAGVDPVRVQQEAAILIDRLDISEECERLRSHLAGMEGMLRNRGEAVGKRFDFLVQEAFREMNTASSKSAQAGISERVVAAKRG